MLGSRLHGWNPPSARLIRGVSVLDLALRIAAFICTFGSAILMGTTYQTLPSPNQLFSIRAQYDDLPTFRLFVFANGIVSAYLLLALPLSIFHVNATAARSSRVILAVFDTVILAFLTAGTSAAAAIIYIAREGNSRANWSSICGQFSNFCERISGSIIGSSIGVFAFFFLILFSSIAIFRC